jgi:hypothetical protein
VILQDDLMQLLQKEPPCQGDCKVSPAARKQSRIESSADLINPKREITLLTVIAVLLEVIAGDFANKDVRKHPSLENQTDLINKIAELETRGLSKRNLEGIFSEAKQAKERSKDC